jgi:hypothetical protein
MNAKQSIHKFRKLVRAEATNQSDTSIYDLNNSIQLFDAREELKTEVIAQISVDLVGVVQLRVGNETRNRVLDSLL